MEISIFEKFSSSFKKPKHLKKQRFSLSAVRGKLKIEPAISMKIDLEMVVFLPQNSKGFLIWIFQGNKINESYCQKQRLWIEMLNKFFKETSEPVCQ